MAEGIPARTPARRAMILLAVGRGTPRTIAAQASGIAKSTLFDWFLAEPEFKEQVIEAESKWADSLLKKAMEIVENTGHKDSAHMITWLLERRMFQFFSRKETVRMGHGGDVDEHESITTAETVQSVAAGQEQLAALVRLLHDAGVGETVTAGTDPAADQVHSTQANGDTNGVSVGAKS